MKKNDLNLLNLNFTNLNNELERVLDFFCQGPKKKILLEAKNLYFAKTGEIFEDDDDFEPRMNLFTDWFIFQYLVENQKIYCHYFSQFQKNSEKKLEKGPSSKSDQIPLNQSDADETKNYSQRVQETFDQVNYSLFEYEKDTLFKEIVLRDLMTNKKIKLAKNHKKLALMKDDFFIGRILPTEEGNFLLKGVCLFPLETKKSIKKESKRVRKLKSLEETQKFLLHLESLKTKWVRYGQNQIHKIFKFQSSSFFSFK